MFVNISHVYATVFLSTLVGIQQGSITPVKVTTWPMVQGAAEGEPGCTGSLWCDHWSKETHMGWNKHRESEGKAVRLALKVTSE